MSDTPRPTPSAGKEEPHRRTAIKGMAAAASVASAAALFPILPTSSQHHHAAPATAADAYQPKLILGPQRELLTAVCDRIIPRTDTPGAADVGVADQIDWIATRRQGLTESISAALKRVDAVAGKPFVSLAPEAQDQVLARMSSDLRSDDGKAFSLLKDLTIDAYYSSKPGLTEELGWNANTYLPEFHGCTHDHLAEDAE
jgi:hypothetical protein